MKLKCHFVIPGSLNQISGGYLYDKHIIDQLKASDHEIIIHEIEGSFPIVEDHTKRSLIKIVEKMPMNEIVIIDGLALIASERILQEFHDRIRFVGLIHHPLYMETGLSDKEREFLFDVESMLILRFKHLITTSEYTKNELRKLNVPDRLISVVRPGIIKNRARLLDKTKQEMRKTKIVKLLCVASFIPRKGYWELIEALSQSKSGNWELTCIGGTDWNKEYFVKIQMKIKNSGLSSKIAIVGEVAYQQLRNYYLAADIFVLPSYYEGYGMVFGEALNFGIPIISTTGGAIPSVVPPNAGILTEPGNINQLVTALSSLIDNPEQRKLLSRGALNEAKLLPTWKQSGAEFERILLRLSPSK